jgi:hypothetical protein
MHSGEHAVSGAVSSILAGKIQQTGEAAVPVQLPEWHNSGFGRLSEPPETPHRTPQKNSARCAHIRPPLH